MISMKPCPIEMGKHVAKVVNIVENAISKTLLPEHKSGKNKLHACELAFYNSIKSNALPFLQLTPAAIEAKFQELLNTNLAYVVFASGSFSKIAKHIPIREQGDYKKVWDKHEKNKKNKKNCTCLYCTVPLNAKKVFNWRAFSQKDNNATPKESLAGAFVKSIGLTVCPYCSRNFIAPLTTTDDAFYRPDLDHFYAKSIYPYFALSPYNLIPSCSACNCRIKDDEDFMGQGFLHPYEHEVPNQLFVLDGPDVYTTKRLDPNNVTLRLKAGIDAKAKKSAEFFQLSLAYEVHKQEVCNFVESLRLMPDSIIKERAKILNTTATRLRATMNRAHTPLDTSYKTRSLGKLMRDMYQLFKNPPP